MNGLSTALACARTATQRSADPDRSVAAPDAAANRGTGRCLEHLLAGSEPRSCGDVKLDAACSEVGRDPATLDVAVGQIVTTPESNKDRDESDSGARFEFTSTESLADEWRGFEEQGVAHLIVWPQPCESECLQLVTAALRNYRAGEGQPGRRHGLRARQRGQTGVSSLDRTGERQASSRRAVARRASERRRHAHLAEQLSLDREVLVPDLRGRGESDRPDDGYDPPTMADDVAELIDRLGIERPALIERLHGGLVAYQLAARRPRARVRGHPG